MDLTSEQRDLRDAVRGLLNRVADSEQLWGRLCGEIGAAGLAIPQRYGGAGAGPVEIHVVMEELGRGLTSSPLLGSAVLAAQALLACGDDAACRRLLPAVAAGSVVAALAWPGPDGGWDPAKAAITARPGAGGWSLTGEAHYVLDGDVAGVLLAVARAPAGLRLFEVDPAAVARRAVTTMDTSRRLAVVRLDGAPGQPLGDGTGAPALALARARDLACIALSAEQVGAAQRALELTVAYSKDRVQFGRPIGGFQALAHRMADLHVLTGSARALSYAAAAAAAEDAPDLPLRAAAAKVYCSETLLTVAAEMIQLHGAIGITWEHQAHRYFKRAHGAAQLFGRPADHAARVAATILAPEA